MKIDKKKAVLVFGRLMNAYDTQRYPFDLPEAIPPQVKENLPTAMVWGSREHACFLFVLCYWMRGGIDSHVATKTLAKLYSACPEMFLPEKVLSFDAQLPLPGMESIVAMKAVYRLIRSIGLAFNAESIARGWIENYEKILRDYRGDPRQLFQSITTFEEACVRIQNRGKQGFTGFQEKMVSMLTYFYMDAGILDRWNFPIPVDFHVLRTVFANQIALPEKGDASNNGFYTKEILEAIRRLSLWYCAEYNVDPIRLCEALWLHSRLMCDKLPANRSDVGGRQGRNTPVSASTISTEAQLRMFQKTCNVCVIQGTCKHSIPSAHYYIGGKLVIRGEREVPPQGHLFPMID
jgi:hypothetical protein